MRDIFSEGLLYLDLLEIYGSSYFVADLCSVAQSNVFRGAQSCSKLLNLDFKKDRELGEYKIHRNHDVQRDLRKLNQKLRARENGQLRIVSHLKSSFNFSSREIDGLSISLPCEWEDHEKSLRYLEQGIIDIVLLSSMNASKYFNWPPPVRRTDLFVPVAPYIVAEVTSLPLCLFMLKGNNSAEQINQSNFLSYEWLLSPSIDIDFMRLKFLDAKLTLLTPPIYSSGNFLSLMLANEKLLLLASSIDSDMFAYDTVIAFDLQKINNNLSFHEHILLVSMPSLLREPLHQRLVDLIKQQGQLG